MRSWLPLLFRSGACRQCLIMKVERISFHSQIYVKFILLGGVSVAMLVQAYSAFVVQNYMQSHAVVLYADPNISLSFCWLSVN